MGYTIKILFTLVISLLENMVTYLSYGFTDIDECEKDLHNCKTKANCNNADGSYNCFCPKGYSGDGTKKEGCQRDDENANANSIVLPIVLGKQLSIP